MSDNNVFLDCIKKLSKTIVKRGENARKPSDGTVCCVVFKEICGHNDSVHLSASVSTITIGTGCDLIDWIVEYCVQTMTKSEESSFSVSSVPCELRFTATLIECYFKPYCFQMSDMEKLAMAKCYKEQGVTLFKSEKIMQAFQKFRRALQYALLLNYSHSDTPDELDLDQVQTLLVNVYNNLAMCHLHYMNYDSVILLCVKSLAAEPNVKAFYRRAVAFISKEEYEPAEKDLIELLKLDGDNKAARQKLSFVQNKLKPSREKYKETIQKMFAK